MLFLIFIDNLNITFVKDNLVQITFEINKNITDFKKQMTIGLFFYINFLIMRSCSNIYI